MTEQWKMSDDDVQMPLGVGGEGGGAGAGGDTPEMSFGEDPKPKFNSATLLLVGVFLAGIGMVYLLGLQNRPRAASAQQTALESQVETALAELMGKSAKPGHLKSLFKDTEQLVAMFYDYPGAGLASLADLPTNPFEQAGTRTVQPVSVAPMPTANLAEQEKMRRMAESFSGLKLQSIMVSKTMSAALINNRLVTVGGKVGEFTVTGIDPERVVLSLGSGQYELKLTKPGEGDAGGKH